MLSYLFFQSPFKHSISAYLDDGRVAILVLAIAPRTDLLPLALDFAHQPGQDDTVAVALVRWDIIDYEHPVGSLLRGVVRRLEARADAFAPFIFIRLALGKEKRGKNEIKNSLMTLYTPCLRRALVHA